MNSKTIIENSNKYLFHLYNRFDVAFVKGEGVYLYDADGKKYLDFSSGIGVNAIGYNDKEFNDYIKNQIDKIYHVSNLFYTDALPLAARSVCEITGLSKVFFTNSGAEAIEGALKTAKKFGKMISKTKTKIISMNHSFHGRTIGSLSVTGTEHYREPFYPLMDGVCFADFNDIESVKKLMDENTCAVIMETVQGEGGIYPADKKFLKQVRELCDKYNALLIIDEIQCGMGRTGSMYAYMKYDTMPDILTTAKALGLGLPVGAFVVNDKVANNSLVPGDHGTTYGGNPLVTSAVYKAIDIIRNRKLVDNVNDLNDYLDATLDSFIEKYDFVKERRGMGFMKGLVVIKSTRDIMDKALKEGLVILTAGKDVLRFLPPLVITKEHIDEFKEKMKKVLDEFV